jgi:membrane associated rhomboid family serine protease
MYVSDNGGGSTIAAVDVDDYEEDDEEEEEIFIVQQQYGYCSSLLSVAQTVIVGLMMWQRGVTPFHLNPMIGPYPDALSEWGSKNEVLIIEDGEWYRLISPIMLHAGIMYLVGNIDLQSETG